MLRREALQHAAHDRGNFSRSAAQLGLVRASALAPLVLLVEQPRVHEPEHERGEEHEQRDDHAERREQVVERERARRGSRPRRRSRRRRRSWTHQGEVGEVVAHARDVARGEVGDRAARGRPVVQRGRPVHARRLLVAARVLDDERAQPRPEGGSRASRLVFSDSENPRERARGGPRERTRAARPGTLVALERAQRVRARRRCSASRGLELVARRRVDRSRIVVLRPLGSCANCASGHASVSSPNGHANSCVWPANSHVALNARASGSSATEKGSPLACMTKTIGWRARSPRRRRARRSRTRACRSASSCTCGRSARGGSGASAERARRRPVDLFSGGCSGERPPVARARARAPRRRRRRRARLPYALTPGARRCPC